MRPGGGPMARVAEVGLRTGHLAGEGSGSWALRRRAALGQTDLAKLRGGRIDCSP